MARARPLIVTAIWPTPPAASGIHSEIVFCTVKKGGAGTALLFSTDEKSFHQ
ncbi:hypothetical protein [Natronohydrobacter thiooxidans]|uniref:hypothetical protein n=1 Tax=Natronohydrobacter thiooxidans TaxID=87172 RepID=UPI001587EB19|nr:hypothetical protein [Natronohydrobacter thiooxidans]